MLTFIVFLCLFSVIQSDLPGKPILIRSDNLFSIVDVNQSATSYEELVKRKEAADVNVAWEVSSGGAPDKAKVLLNGKEVWCDSTGPKGSASFQVCQGGKYQMVVKVCNVEGCSESNAREVIVADTDGSHLSPLKYLKTENNKEFQQISKKVIATYFTEYGIYSKSFFVNNIPVPNLTHILYGFIAICGGDGVNEAIKQVKESYEVLQRSCKGRDDFKVTIQDHWAALRQPQGELSAWNEPYKGNFGQLMSLKQSNKQVRILASIGGWLLSDSFFLMANEEKRKIFVDSVREFLLTWKFFDGVNIHWSYPGGGGANSNLGSPQDGETYFLLMKELRGMLTMLSTKAGKYYQLTSAINPTSDKPQVVNYNVTQRFINNYFLMSYDFKGEWANDPLGHHTALYAPEWRKHEKLTTNEGVKYLLSQGVEPKKIVVGVPTYGRGWTGVHGYTGDNPFTGKATGPFNSFGSNGVIDYKIIAKEASNNEWQFRYDDVAQGAYVFRKSTGDLITYENGESVLNKADYVKKNNLGGLFVWDISGDNGDILNAMNIGLGNPVV